MPQRQVALFKVYVSLDDPAAWASMTAAAHKANRGPKDHLSIRILQSMISGITLCWALQPVCRILMFIGFLSALVPQAK